MIKRYCEIKINKVIGCYERMPKVAFNYLYFELSSNNMKYSPPLDGFIIFIIKYFGLKWLNLKLFCPGSRYLNIDIFVEHDRDIIPCSLNLLSSISLINHKLPLIIYCYSGFQYNRSKSIFYKFLSWVNIKKLTHSTPLTWALKFSKFTSVKSLILNWTHAGTYMSSGFLSKYNILKHYYIDDISFLRF